jgi:tetratricopeptide (TPR) repeat protein
MNMFLKIFFLLAMSSYSFGHGTLHEQIANLTQVIEKEPNSAELYLRRGEVYRDHEEWKSAADDYNKARTLNPKLLDIDLAEARLYFYSDHLEQAQEKVEQYLKVRQDENARYLRAQILVELKQTSKAIADFSYFIEHAKDPQPQVFIERAKAQVLTGKRKEAIVGLDEGMKKLGVLISLQELAIQLELEGKEFDQALVRVDSILKTLNRKENWLARKGEILEQAGRTDEAKRFYKQALSEITSLPQQYQKTRAVSRLKAELENKIK